VQHVQPFDRPFPWRAAALAATALALAELATLLALAGIRLFDVHHAAASTHRPVRTVQAAPQRPPRHLGPLRPRSRISVLVLNGNGITGAAGTEATKLLAAGYRRATASDAAQDYASSLVLFRRGWEREAQRLARAAGIRTVAPLDGRLPGSEASYQLVLILGSN
jgi:LytR cell envelope-related transcriptional attenuator